MALVRHGNFEWDERKARSNERKHGITFEEAATVFLDDLSVPFGDLEHPDRLILLGMSLERRILVVVFANERAVISFVSSALGKRPLTSGSTMRKTARGPSKASLREIPEVDFSKLRRLPRGRFAHLSTGRDVHYVSIDPDLWPHFRSGAAVNAALRAVIEVAETVKSGSKSRRRARRAA